MSHGLSMETLIVQGRRLDEIARRITDHYTAGPEEYQQLAVAIVDLRRELEACADELAAHLHAEKETRRAGAVVLGISEEELAAAPLPSVPAPPAQAWLLTEKRKDGRIVNEAIALTNDAATAWVRDPNVEFGQARSSLPLKILPPSAGRGLDPEGAQTWQATLEETRAWLQKQADECRQSAEQIEGRIRAGRIVFNGDENVAAHNRKNQAFFQLKADAISEALHRLDPEGERRPPDDTWAFAVDLFNIVMADLEWVRAQGGRHSVCPLCHAVCDRDGGPGHLDECPRMEFARRFDTLNPNPPVRAALPRSPGPTGKEKSE